MNAKESGEANYLECMATVARIDALILAGKPLQGYDLQMTQRLKTTFSPESIKRRAQK